MDLFGRALVAGDFDGDGYSDLAMGAPGEDVNDPVVLGAGAVNVLYGSASGLTGYGDDCWWQGNAGVLGTAEESDWFGQALAASDFDGDGHDDLAVGAPGEDTSFPVTRKNAGVVNVLFGSASGLDVGGNTIWSQENKFVEDAAEDDDYFGWSLAASDFNGDGYGDLAVGVPWEDVGKIEDAGAVNTLFGSAHGLTATDDEFWHQDSPGVYGVAEEGDQFGSVLAAIPAWPYRIFLPLAPK
jgi:hypothetical protein